MIEVRLHGRGGQGAVTAANLIAMAASKEGMNVQAFPAFGVERRGAAVMAFVRMDKNPIMIRSQIYSPDMVVVLDPTLIETVDVLAGMKKGGTLLLNTKGLPEKFKKVEARVALVDATGIAISHGIGSRTNPIVNTAILGGFVKASNLISIETMCEIVKDNAPGDPKKNVDAVREAYEKTRFGGE
jgi:2-oxoacid:acceptor oxidoreductase gamma subunit (pyruvate/2-ketoisovalerate family)